jgi:predicted RNA methylase
MFRTFVRSVLSIPRKLSKSLRLRGVAGTARAVVRYVGAMLQELGPTRRRLRKMDLEFDRRHHVDTAGCIPLSELNVASGNWVYGNRYETTPFAEFEALMKSLPVNYQEFVFLDIGCGKGRAMLLASDYPFQKILGIDLADELIEVCKRNMASYRSDSQKCRALEAHACDAVTFPLPTSPLVLYMYNPFGAEVMTPMLASIEQSLTACPRDLFVAYYYPVHRDLLDQASFLERFASGRGYSIWRRR